MHWYEVEVRQLERSLAGRAAAPPPIVFYGSSSFRLWDSLALDLGGDPRILNLAFGGSTLEACVHFFERLVAPVRPASLVVYAGDNDLGDGKQVQDVFRAYRALAEKVAKQLDPIPFGFLTVKPSVSRTHLMDRIRQVNALVMEEAARRPGAYIIDVFTPMLNGGGLPRPELFLEDGLHLSRTGYEVWAQTILQHRNRIFI